MEEIACRRITIPHSIMEVIDKKVQHFRDKGVPEHELKKYRNSLIESNAESKDVRIQTNHHA